MASAPAPQFGPLSIVPASPRGLGLGALLLGVRGSDLRSLEDWLHEEGWDVVGGSTESGARRPDAVLVEVSGTLELSARMAEARALGQDVVVVALTPEGDPDAALGALRAGALDCIPHPFDSARVRVALARAAERTRTRVNLRELDAGAQAGPLPGRMSGRSRAIQTLASQVSRVVERDIAVFLEGEQGSGVDLVARAIHAGSSRAGGPLLTFDCSASEPSDHEAQLAGRELGSGRTTSGALEQASGGVLYIDNIDRLAQGAQAVLARYLATRQVRRVDGGAPVLLNTRIIASADTDLRALVSRGAFREDLYFRLVVFPIRVPPLRERPEDVPFVVGRLVQELAVQMGGEAPRTIQTEALDALLRYPWPGNVRELENVIQRSMLSSRGDAILKEDLPPELRLADGAMTPANHNASDQLFGEEIVPLRELERRAIEHALKLTDGNVAIAAKKLGIGRATLYRRIASLEVSVRVA